MKTKFTLLIVLIASVLMTKAQVGQLPNYQFQTWTSSLTPDGWVTPDALAGFSLGLTVRDTVDVITGAKCSVELICDSIVIPSEGVVTGAISVGTGSLNQVTDQATFYGIPFPYRPDTIFYAFQFTPGESDTTTATGIIELTKAGVPVMGGPWQIDTTSAWRLGEVVLTPAYFSDSIPDTLSLQFVASYGAPIKGATMHLQEVYFGYVNLPSSIQELANKLNLSIYPNPASNSINISGDQDFTGCKIVITDINGQVVEVNNLAGQKSSLDIHMLASGTYIYRIADSQGNIFKQDKFIVTR